jgi:hypothetical protein
MLLLAADKPWRQRSPPTQPVRRLLTFLVRQAPATSAPCAWPWGLATTSNPRSRKHSECARADSDGEQHHWLFGAAGNSARAGVEPKVCTRPVLSVAAKKGTKMATKWSPAGRAVRSEPFPLLRSVVRNGPEPSRARRCWARRSEPLTARTVLR